MLNKGKCKYKDKVQEVIYQHAYGNSRKHVTFYLSDILRNSDLKYSIP